MNIRTGLLLTIILIFNNALFGGEKVGLIEINGAIGPATASYVDRAIKVSEQENYKCLIIQLDTPGGLLDSTKDIVQSFYKSKVPIVVYVAPSGANAGSAGCFITLAADIAAMAPNTSIGAAHPVAVGGGMGDQKPDDTMKQKLENFATSYIEAIAVKRNRNVEWAKSAVKESASITSEKALELKVIEIIAKDTEDLLKQIDTREINGKQLKTVSAEVVNIPMILREKLFQVLWRPEVMFILMLIAIYGIIGELSNPGAIFPGVVGAIALILALYMAAILPVNLAGLALILLAIALFIMDVFAVTHGVLTAGGIISFVLGSIMLFDQAESAMRLSLSLIIPSAIVTAAFFTFVFGKGIKAQFLPAKTGKEAMKGKIAEAITEINGNSGKVFVDGEYWNAVSDSPIESGAPVEIIEMQGLILKVKPANKKG